MKPKSLLMSILQLTTLHSSTSPTHPLRDSLLEAHTQNETYVHPRAYNPPADSSLALTRPTQPLQDSLFDAQPQNEANLSKPIQTRGSKRLHYLTQPKLSQSVSHPIIQSYSGTLLRQNPAIQPLEPSHTTTLPIIPRDSIKTTQPIRQRNPTTQPLSHRNPGTNLMRPS